MQERDYYLGFSVFPGVGPIRFQELLTVFGSAKNAWYADSPALRPILGNSYTEKFISFRNTFALSDYLMQLQKNRIWFVVKSEDAYPVLLSLTENPPYVVYGKGDKNCLNGQPGQNYIGVVGTRKITDYGRHVTEMITEDLVSAGCIIVSGLALGVDAVAHKKALATGGKTIAVLGSGIDVCHPGSNTPIYNSIISSGGAVVSEYSLGESPSRGSFPARNRIIAGLSDGIVVTEGAADSGALITAEDARSFGRRVYAVPGPITSSLAKGPNSLLANDARLVTSGEDILADLGMEGIATLRSVRNLEGETVEEQSIIDLLRNEALLFDEIVKLLHQDTVNLNALLSMMELKGMIEQSEGKYRLRA